MQYIDKTYLYYINQINKVPLLSREEEYDLALKAQKGKTSAKQKLVLANLRFVVQIARRYSNCGLSFMDLISEGNIGLLRAVETFDPKKGYHFISYAVHWIKQSIIKAISEKSKIMRIPLHLNNSISHIEKSFREDHEDQFTDRSVEAVSKKMNMRKKDMLKLIEVSRGYTSLDKELSPGSTGGESSLQDLIVDEKIPGPEYEVIDNNLKDEIDDMLGNLSEQEADVIKHRYGLEDNEPLTLQEIGKIKNVTKERIRQIEKKALDTLKKPQNSEKLRDYIN